MAIKSSREALLDHLADVQRLIVLRKPADKENAALLMEQLERHAKRHRALARLRITAFIFLYASIVSAFAGSLPLLSTVVQTIAAVTGIVGVGVLTLLTLYLTWQLQQAWNRMLILYGHLIAIYEKNNTSVLKT